MENYDTLRQLSVSTDGYVGDGYAVRIDFETGRVDWSASTLFYQNPKYLKTLDAREAEAFKHGLETAGLLGWRKKYYDLSCLDGPIWEMHLVFENSERRLSGTAAYPETWEVFCELVREMTGKTFR